MQGSGGVMASEGNVEALRQVLDGFNGHDLDAIMSHFAEDCVFDSPRGARPVGAPLCREGRGAPRAGRAL